MSVYTNVYAMDSMVQAPEIGDNGCIGFPPVATNGKAHDFLRIYRGLSQIGLITQEMASFHAFIEAYGDEHLYFYVENDDGPDAHRLNEILEELDREGKKIPVFELKGEANFTKAKYKISSDKNHYISRYADYFLQTNSFTIEKENLSELIDDVFKADDWEAAFYRVWGIVDPYDGDLDNIRKFVLGNSGPFTIEFLAGDLVENEAPSEFSVEDPTPLQTTPDVDKDISTEGSKGKRSLLIKVRDTIIFLFIIWVVVRVLYHGYIWLTG